MPPPSKAAISHFSTSVAGPDILKNKFPTTRRQSAKKEKNRPQKGFRPNSFRAAPKPPPQEAYEFKVQPSAKVLKSLAQIGVPETGAFEPDKFQRKAVAAAISADVLVSAPTGSGKTWIAEQVILRELAQGGRCWYASPLKALSNAKFLEFGQLFGQDKVGLLTGDHKVNPDAPLIVGTTEILRNQLYDVQSYGQDLSCDLVVLDEAHYLGDPDRGVVWEETLIYLPPRVKLLLLSATMANSAELAAWLSHHRKRKTTVITSTERPVPLASLCLWPSGHVVDLPSAAGTGPPGQRRGRRHFNIQIPNSKIMGTLRELNLLPAIFFLKSRADCDAALSQVGSLPDESPERFEARQELIANYLEKYPFLSDHPHLKRIRRQGVAAHHAGHLPHYKFLVEELMSRGLLDAIFATSTVSAGVNFPARTVVIRQSDRFDGQGFSDLRANEFTQMTGRAGRRGRDFIGFVMAIPGPHQDLGLLAGLLNSPPDPIKSSLQVNFSMILNLLNAYRLTDVRQLLRTSLATWQKCPQKGTSPTPRGLEQAAGDLYDEFLRHLHFLQKEGLADANHQLTADGQWATGLRLDHPLVFYSAIKEKAWPQDPSILAAAVAGLLSEKDSSKPLPRRQIPQRLTVPLTNFFLAIAPMISSLDEAGFPYPIFNLRPAWALWSWATRGDFAEAVALLGLGEGDLAMLALRTADHLRQIAALKGQPELSTRAREAISRLLKEPISSPL